MSPKVRLDIASYSISLITIDFYNSYFLFNSNLCYGYRDLNKVELHSIELPLLQCVPVKVTSS